MIDFISRFSDWVSEASRRLSDWVGDDAHRFSEWIGKETRLPLTWESWADTATLAMLALMFVVMLYYAIRRTWRWDRLGTALTIVVACLALSYSFGLASIFLTHSLWVPWVRWTIRGLLLGGGAFAILVMKLDEPTSRRTERTEKTDANATAVHEEGRGPREGEAEG